MNLRLSVVTVCYNSGKTIESTFKSVLNQTELPYEYIVVDGASIDNTISIIDKYKKIFESRNVLFKYISEPDNGLYYAMNKALKLITGEWVHYLNSDDAYFNSNVLSQITSILNNNSNDIIFGNMVVIYENGHKKIIKPSPLPRRFSMYFTCPFQQPATFIRFSVLNKVGFDFNYKNSADYKLFVELICSGISYKYINTNITNFSVGGASINLANMNSENIRFFKEINLPIGSFIHSCYIHMYILYYLRTHFPSFHSLLKHLFNRK